MVNDGIRGLTSNPTILQKAIQGSPDYDEQFKVLAVDDKPVTDDYWALVLQDINGALDVFAPLYEQSGGRDGFASVEVVAGPRSRHRGHDRRPRATCTQRINRPNLFVKIPATAEGVPAIKQMISEGRSINVTLIFSLDRYADVMEAYLSGLEACTGDLSRVASVASFFISRVDTEVDRRLDAIGTPEALAQRGKAAVAQGKLAYKLFTETFAGPRWDALDRRGAQRAAAALGVDVDEEPGLPRHALRRRADRARHGEHDARPDDRGVRGSRHRRPHGRRRRRRGASATGRPWRRFGIDVDDVARVLEEEGLSSFVKSFDELLAALQAKADEIAAQM